MENVAKNLQNFIKLRRDMWLHWFVWFGLVFAGILSAAAYISAIHPAAGEILQNTLIGVLMSSVVVTSFFLGVAIARGFYLSTVDLIREMRAEPEPVQEAPALLPEYSIGDDILLAHREGETLDEWNARFEAAEKQANKNKWVVVVKFRSPVFSLLTGATVEVYDRDEAVFKMPETFPDFSGKVCESRLFTEETPEDYAEYLARFCRIFREWSPRQKAVRAASRSAGALLDAVKNSVNILLFLLVAFPAFSQSKTRQVDEALGTRIREIPAAGQSVSFMFDLNGRTKTYNRVGDGKSSYTELLQKSPGLVRFDDEGGTLVAVMSGETIIARTDFVQNVNTAPREPQPMYATQAEQMRPQSAIDPNTLRDNGGGFVLPDSVTIQREVDNGKHSIDEFKAGSWSLIKPIWGFAMYIFYSASLMLACFIGLFRYVAKTAANESLINTYGRVIVGRWIVSAQQNAAAGTLFLTWIVAIFLLIDFFLALVWLNLPMWTIVLIWFPTLWLAGKITNWIVPNIRVVSNERGVNPF